MRINYGSDVLQPKGCQKPPGNGLKVDVQPVEAISMTTGGKLEPVRRSPC